MQLLALNKKLEKAIAMQARSPGIFLGTLALLFLILYVSSHFFFVIPYEIDLVLASR